MKLDINEQFEEVFDVLENTNHHVFLTGKAGTGKSTLLDLFRDKTDKQIAVVAPTGVAAVNVKGETIHSFFGFRPTLVNCSFLSISFCFYFLDKPFNIPSSISSRYISKICIRHIHMVLKYEEFF